MEGLPVPTWYAAIVAFLFGTCVGSFLNVVIARVPRGMSIVRPRSQCPTCKKAIAWYDNLPLLSWILLRGRCRGCKLPISVRYPLVELSGGLLAVACLLRITPLGWAAAAFAFLAALVALTYIDLEHWLLPHPITWSFTALGIAASFLPGGTEPASAALGAAAGFASFVVVGKLAELILKKEALGGGDAFLFAMIGSWLGLRSLLPVLLLATVQGSLVGGLLLLVARHKSERDLLPPPTPIGDAEADQWVPDPHAVPFGPFLALGAAEYLFFGEQLVSWYLSLLERGA